MCCYGWVPGACLAVWQEPGRRCLSFHRWLGSPGGAPTSGPEGRGAVAEPYLAVVPFLSFHLRVQELVGGLHGVCVWFGIARYHVVQLESKGEEPAVDIWVERSRKQAWGEGESLTRGHKGKVTELTDPLNGNDVLVFKANLLLGPSSPCARHMPRILLRDPRQMKQKLGLGFLIALPYLLTQR